MTEEKPSKSGCGWMHLLWLAAVTLLGMAMVPPCMNVVIDKSGQAATAGNCRQIVAALKLYATEHGGKYPDADSSAPATANQAFRILIREGVLDDERVFSAIPSKFVPDNNIGEAPEFSEALQAGENHWAMTKAVTTKSPPLTPLVFENPVASGWPPMWNADAAGKNQKGRTWKGGKIIVCFNDTSAQVIKLESDKGTEVLPAREADGKDVFTRVGEAMEILDILE